MAQFPAAEGLCPRFWCSHSYPSSLPGHLGSKPLVEEELHRRDEGIGRSLSKPADGRIAHGLGEFGKQLLIPLALLKQGDRLVATDTAGRTLAAGFVLEETEEIDGDLGNIVFVGKDDDGMAADKGAVLVEGPEIERYVGKAGGENTARGRAGQIRFELLSLLHTAGQFDQLARSDAGRRDDDSRLLYSPRDRPRAEAFGAVNAVIGEPLGALQQDFGNPIKRLDIVVQRRTPE